MKKIIVLLTALLVLVGCGAKNETPEGKQKLQIATWANEREAQELEEILETLNEKSDTYEIEHVLIPEDYYTKVQTMIAGNKAPDLIWLAQEYIPAYVKNEVVLDLSEMLENQDVIDMNDYFDGSLDTAKSGDKVYGLPWIGQPYVVYYNKTMFEEKGVDLPTSGWTWDEFIETAKSLTGEGVYGYGNTGSLPSPVLAWGYGGDTVDENGNVLLTTDETVQGMEKLYEIMSDDSITMPFIEAESMGVEPAFINGTVGMFIGGANDDVEVKVEESDAPFEVGMAVMPAGPKNHVTFNWTASTLITSQSSNHDVAFEALIDLTEAFFDWKVPAPVASKASNIVEINKYKAYAFDVIEESMEIARGFNNLPEQNELGSVQWETLDFPIINNNDGKGNLDIKAILEDTQAKFESIIK